jgi:hypothetical protein
VTSITITKISRILIISFSISERVITGYVENVSMSISLMFRRTCKHKEISFNGHLTFSKAKNTDSSIDDILCEEQRTCAEFLHFAYLLHPGYLQCCSPHLEKLAYVVRLVPAGINHLECTFLFGYRAEADMESNLILRYINY